MEKEGEHKHPPWEAPKSGFNAGLEVYNSLTSTKGKLNAIKDEHIFFCREIIV
jgi:hypothetical protein